MAFFLGMLGHRRAPKVDVLYLMRTDKERALGRTTELAGYSSRFADWVAESRVAVGAQKLLGVAHELRGGGLGRAALRSARYTAVARARVLRRAPRMHSTRQANEMRLQV